MKKNITIVKYLCVAFVVTWIIWIILSFYLSKSQTEQFCHSLQLGMTQDKIEKYSLEEGFVFSKIGSFIHKKEARGRFVCSVEFDKNKTLTKRSFSSVD